jgi:hypothetical protein
MHAIPQFLWPLQKHLFHQTKATNEHCCKTNPATKHFHKWKGHCTPYNYTTLDFQEIAIMCFIIFFVKIYGAKNTMIDTPSWPKPLFLQLWTMICLSNFLNNDQFSLSKQPWMCIFNMGLHMSDLIKLVVFDKTFL